MKDISELNLPDTIRYAKTHEWAALEADSIKIGISDYAQNRLGDVTFVELPQVGDVFRKGNPFGTVESTKAVSDLFMPVGGEISAVNPDLAETPGLLNSDPYRGGWLIIVKPEDPAEIESLMTSDGYRDMLGRLE